MEKENNSWGYKIIAGVIIEKIIITLSLYIPEWLAYSMPIHSPWPSFFGFLVLAAIITHPVISLFISL